MYKTRLLVFKTFVLDLSSLSKCTERKVAAIITDDRLQQIYSIGINGGPKYQADCLCITDGKYGCIHAEINALIKCTDSKDNKIMICSLLPCKQCATAIVNAPYRFNAVYYVDNWKDTNGLDILINAGIETQQI